MSGSRRGRGRPSGSDSARTRRSIVDAARRQFADRGFRGTSVRSIAAEAGVDASLIHHHFGGKSQLLIATMELPFDPLERLSTAVEGPAEGLAARIVHTFCVSWDPHRDVFSALMRSALDGGIDNPLVLQLARNVMIETIASALDGDNAHLRADLVAGQLIGLAVMRYVARVEPLASAPVDEVVALYAPAMRRIITPDSY